MGELIQKSNTEVGAVKTVNRGLEEGYDKKDLQFPRAKLMQAMSPEVQEQSIAQGVILNNLSGEPCPESFIPIFKFTNYVKFNSRKTSDPNYNEDFEPGSMIWNITDPHDPRAQEAEFGENGEKPTAIKFMNFMVLFEGEDTPCIISFSKTSYKAGKKLLSLLAFSKGDIFSKKFKLVSKKIKGDEGYYYVYDVVPNGKASDEEFVMAEYIYGEFAHRKDDIKIDVDDDDVVKTENASASADSDVSWN
jgi:hypothetical protein